MWLLVFGLGFLTRSSPPPLDLTGVLLSLHKLVCLTNVVQKLILVLHLLPLQSEQGPLLYLLWSHQHPLAAIQSPFWYTWGCDLLESQAWLHELHLWVVCLLSLVCFWSSCATAFSWTTTLPAPSTSRLTRCTWTGKVRFWHTPYSTFPLFEEHHL